MSAAVPPPLPSWLDADREVAREPPDRPAPRAPFVLACMDALVALGCSVQQAAEVTANAVVETGWGKAYRGWNLGGWKLTRSHAEAYRAAHGVGPRWWRAPGHVRAGDAAWCYYRAFDSLQDFLREWLEHFVPRPEIERPPYPGYKATGQAFWSGETGTGHWFRELIRVGYKGPRTRAAPEGSVRDHASITRTCLRMWATPRGAP